MEYIRDKRATRRYMRRHKCFALFVFQTRDSVAAEMAPRKGFSPFTPVISPELSPQLTWFILSSKVCGSTPTQYFKRSPVVASFPSDFQRIDSAYIRLLDGRQYSNKKSSNATEIVCSSFGLITTLLRRSSSESSEFISQLRDLLNSVDLSEMSVDEKKRRPSKQRTTTCFTMLGNANDTNEQDIICGHDTPNSGNSQRAEKKNVSPNLKEISEKEDLDTPEKVLLMKQRSSRVIKDVHDVCERNRESLAMVLSNMCAFGDPEAKAIVSEIVEEVAVKRGVKRSVEELVGDDTMSKYVACLRVPDWKLVLFQAMARVSSKTWQSVINITGLGRTRILLKDINHQKKILKEQGITVDGRHYTVEFLANLVVLD
ncbi:uncharacterized protein [Pocillopora verrucosa]|uniref:uncharacterized protein isoform X2 n=1 Tax=Pocillopora verrucosa TaxID=203993 RepID=UPI00333EB695